MSTAGESSSSYSSPPYFKTSWLTDVNRLIGELTQLSRKATPNPPSHPSTPGPEIAISAPGSVSGRGQTPVAR